MGAEESKQRGEDEDQQRKTNDSSSSSSSGTAAALAVGAAVGTALAVVSLYRANTSDNDQKLQHRYADSVSEPEPEPDYKRESYPVVWRGVSPYRSNTSDIEQRLQNHYADNDSEPKYELESHRGAAWGGGAPYRANTSDIDQRLQHHYADSDSEPEYELESHIRPHITNSFRNLQVSNYKPEMAKNTLKILSYNVCSREEYPIPERMEAISALVQLHSPDFICFQEITPGIYKIFQSSSWWGDYYCSMSEEEANNKQYFCILLCKFEPVSIIKPSIGTSRMPRELCVMQTKVGNNKSLVVATSHLKTARPDPNIPASQYHQFKRERMVQASEALAILQKYPNVMFCGDMNWNEKTDGEFPLPKGWVDAWTELRVEEKGYTFDTKSNEMLNGRRPLRRRLDRILCNLKGFRLDDIEIIGKEPIPDVSYRVKKKMLPVLPSDHYGLLLTVCTY